MCWAERFVWVLLFFLCLDLAWKRLCWKQLDVFHNEGRFIFFSLSASITLCQTRPGIMSYSNQKSWRACAGKQGPEWKQCFHAGKGKKSNCKVLKPSNNACTQKHAVSFSELVRKTRGEKPAAYWAKNKGERHIYTHLEDPVIYPPTSYS